MNSMNEDISDKIADIADLVGEKEEVIRDRLKTLNFRDYIELSKAVKETEMEKAQNVLQTAINAGDAKAQVEAQ